jgi:hypothetical protein
MPPSPVAVREWGAGCWGLEDRGEENLIRRPRAERTLGARACEGILRGLPMQAPSSAWDVDSLRPRGGR